MGWQRDFEDCAIGIWEVNDLRIASVVAALFVAPESFEY